MFDTEQRISHQRGKRKIEKKITLVMGIAIVRMNALVHGKVNEKEGERERIRGTERGRIRGTEREEE